MHPKKVRWNGLRLEEFSAHDRYWVDVLADDPSIACFQSPELNAKAQGRRDAKPVGPK